VNRSGKDRLDAAGREKLGALVGAQRNRRVDTPKDRRGAVTASAPSTHTDFATLPGYKDILTQRAAAQLVGISNPFFRVHEGHAGAVSCVDGREVINFSSYDYLGLNQHPDVATAARNAVDQYGVSASASRVVAGERAIHRALESELASLYQTQDCVVMVSGHATNVTAIAALMGPRDLIVTDQLAHNSIFTGAVLSGAERRVFPHNDMQALDALLNAQRHLFERVLVAVEGTYSMDGDFPDLPALVALKRRHNAWLMVDEAHALGVLGKRGFGIAEHFGVNPSDVDIWMGTLSKTLAACGGYIAGSAVLVDYLKCTAGGFVYSVGLPPPVAASALAALAVMRREPERVQKLAHNGRYFVEYAASRGLNTGTSTGNAIVPVILGDSLKAVFLSESLYKRGVNALPIIAPAVPEKTARLRFFMNCHHTEAQIRASVDAVVEELAKLPGTQQLLAGLLPSRR
jgi:8-amino-7-oxononanoate synthase